MAAITGQQSSGQAMFLIVCLVCSLMFIGEVNVRFSLKRGEVIIAGSRGYGDRLDVRLLV